MSVASAVLGKGENSSFTFSEFKTIAKVLGKIPSKKTQGLGLSSFI
jgi:hypothetical protein